MPEIIAQIGIIAGAAVGLELAVRWLEEGYRVGKVIVFGLKAAEYPVFSADLLLFGVFLWRTAKRTIRQL